MIKVLVVQSRSSEKGIEREQKNFKNSIGERADVAFLSATDERHAWTTPDEFLRDFDGVIFGGSADFDFHGGRIDSDPARLMSFLILSRTRNLVSYVVEHEMPLLGICFGHQLIAQMRGGDVSNDKEQSKFGSFEVQLTEEGLKDPLFRHIPASFVAQYAHNDSVTQLPEGATVLGNSNGCRFSALRYGPRAYTLQFHPEVTRFEDLPLEYRDSSEASRIIALWIEHIVAPATKKKETSSAVAA